MSARWTLCVGRDGPARCQPFTDITLREVKRIIAGRRRHDGKTEQDEVAEALLALQNRTDAPESWTLYLPTNTSVLVRGHSGKRG